jgi:hypothetical protein
MRRMCFRLWAALADRSALPSTEQTGRADPEARKALEELAVSKGLDVRVSREQPLHFLEIAWGDCACSLYSGREGRQRVVSLVDGLVQKGFTVQLLLFTDGEPLNFQSQPPHRVSLEDFRREALAALPEGKVAELQP